MRKLTVIILLSIVVALFSGCSREINYDTRIISDKNQVNPKVLTWSSSKINTGLYLCRVSDTEYWLYSKASQPDETGKYIFNNKFGAKRSSLEKDSDKLDVLDITTETVKFDKPDEVFWGITSDTEYIRLNGELLAVNNIQYLK